MQCAEPPPPPPRQRHESRDYEQLFVCIEVQLYIVFILTQSINVFGTFRRCFTPERALRFTAGQPR